jgi:medium-chain acyl-[acyl-carrier-protein] hydrolase
MRLLIPILRADFSVNETYTYVAEEPIDVGISAFGGLSDEDVNREDVEAWKEHTRGRFRARMLPGDHFFINSAKDLVLESISRDLAEVVAPALPRSW